MKRNIFSVIKTSFLLASILSVCVFHASTPAQEQSPQSPAGSKPLSVNPNYRIGVGDLLKVVVIRNELLSLDGVRVGNRGTIRLPMLDADVPAACLTENELSAAVVGYYRKYMLNPQVYVSVKEIQSNPVALLGSVTTPGRFQLQRPIRLLELLTFANGPSPSAGRTIQIIRTPQAVHCEENNLVKSLSEKAEDQEVISLSLAETMKGDEAANPFVQPGDIIRITESQQAFVVGFVRSAVTVNLKEPVTLTKALAMAGGVSPEADIKKVKITRQEIGSLTKTEIMVNLKELNQPNRQDILLQANDIIEVKGQGGTKKFLMDIFKSTIPMATRFPVPIP